jgi:predicted nucleotidyltransferase
MSNSKIKIPGEKIAEFCKKNHIRKLSLFGSVLRDDFFWLNLQLEKYRD